MQHDSNAGMTDSSENYADRLDFYQRGPFAPYLVEARTAGAAPARLARLKLPAGSFVDPATPDFTLIVGSGQPFRTEVRTGEMQWRGRFSRGDILVPPPNMSTAYTDDDPLEIAVVSFPTRALAMIYSEVGVEFSSLMSVFGYSFRDELISQLCFRLWDEAADDNPLGSVFADGALMAIAVTLLRRSRPASFPSQRAIGGLAPYRLRRATDLAIARLQDDLSIADLAEAAGLSPFHFARALRREVGKSPHEWLLEHRLNRAKEFLRDSNLPIGVIASMCGFKSRAGFGAAFKRILGTTPRGWRDSI